ncbi:MAG: VWA domain-containing protein [Candidatus Lernaella stagnicola]|nr:VWA domain-containing protein [Candidatus Lernaella stagnicola]
MTAHGISWGTFAALYGALAAAIIVIFLLRLTRRGRAVSSTLIWEKVIGARRSLWQEIVSLIVQLLLILLICLALVDPRPPAENITRRWVGVVFDSSESMAARQDDASRLRQAGRRAWESLEALDETDRVMIVRAGSTVEALTPFTGSQKEIKKALAALEADGVRPQFNEAVSYVLSAFDYAEIGENDTKHLWIVTDRPEDLNVPQIDGVDTRVVTTGTPAANVAITSFSVRRTMNLSASYDLMVEVTNYGEANATANLAIFTEKQTLGVQTLSLAPSETFLKVFGLPFEASGKLTALLREIAFAGGAVDALRSDDAAFAFVPPVRKARVVLVSNKNVFLYNALALNPEISLNSLSPGEYTHAMSVGADVVVFDRFAPKQLPACSAVYFGPAGGPFASAGKKEDPAMTSWADGHPVLRHVTMDKLTIEETQVFQPQAKDVVLMGHYDNALMLLRESEGRFLLGVGFDLAATDFPLQSAFPIFMHNVVHVFSRRPEGEIRTSYQIGERVELAVTAGREQVVVKTPLDKKEVAPVRAGQAVYRPATPGFYQYADAGALRVFAVSLTEPAESDLTVGEVVAMPEVKRQTKAVTAEIWWPWLVLAALLLAALDTVLFFYGRLA